MAVATMLAVVSGCGDLLGANFDDGHLQVADAAEQSDTSTQEATSPTSDAGDSGAVAPHVVMFSGLTGVGDGTEADTWTWDGTWVRRDVTVHPSARTEHAMATLGRTVVLFGGIAWGTETVFGDTWVWDGIRWEEKHPAHSPEPRSGHKMATVNGHVVLYGGTGATIEPVKDQVVWSWDGTDWTHGAAGSPTVFNDGGYPLGFTMSGSGDTLALYKQLDSYPPKAETWLRRTGWTTLGPADTTVGDMMTTLPDGAGFLLVGASGVDEDRGEHAWVLGSNQTWTALSPSPIPPARGASAMVTFRGKVMLFGGGDIGEAVIFYNDTWVFDGAAWTKMPASVFDPPVRYRHAMAAIE